MKKVILSLTVLLSGLLAFGTVERSLAISDLFRVMIGESPDQYEPAAITEDLNGEPFCFNGKATDFVLHQNADHVGGTTPTLDSRIEYSADRTNWKTLYSFTQVTTSDAIENIHVPNDSVHPLRCMRAVVDVGGTNPEYNVIIAIYYKSTAN